MTIADFGLCQSRIYLHEGGYTNDLRDPGGPTNWGITIFDARKYAAEFGWITGRAITADDIRAMPKSFADKVYKAKYWDMMHCDELPAGVDDSIDDYGVNSGIGRSGKVLRRVVGQPDNDWRVTPAVLAAVKQRDPADLINAINDERMRFLCSLSTFDHFGPGWTRRVAEVRAFSLALASGKVVALPPPSQPVQQAGKGHVAPPPNTKPVATAGSTASAAAGGMAHWIGAHPELTAGIVVGGIAITIFAVRQIEARHAAKQEAPTPGTVPVPIKQAA